MLTTFNNYLSKIKISIIILKNLKRETLTHKRNIRGLVSNSPTLWIKSMALVIF